jgi:hypothetical protein
MQAVENPPKSRSLFSRAASGIADRLSHPAPLPPSPRAPGVDQSAWARNVEQKRISPDMTIHDVGLSVFGETRSFSDLPGSNEPIGSAREKVAHMILNGVALRGSKHPSVHAPVEPSEESLRNPAERAAYESSMRAAREAYLAGTDPTRGAIYMRLLGTPDRSNIYGTAPLHTQSGPYRNSFPNQSVPSDRAWVNTYGSEGKR